MQGMLEQFTSDISSVDLNEWDLAVGNKNE